MIEVAQEKAMRITFDKGSRDFILDAFGKCVNEDGFIADKKDPTQKVLTPRGEEIKASEFIGVRKGSTIFVKSDIVSIVETAMAIH